MPGFYDTLKADTVVNITRRERTRKVKKYQELQEIFGQLAREWHDADQAGNTVRKAQLRQQLDEVEAAIWQATTTFFPELAPYESCAEAVEQLAYHHGIPFPDLTDSHHHTDHLGRRFHVSNDRRGINITPFVGLKTYDVVLFDFVDYYIDREQQWYDLGVYYAGRTNDLIEALCACSLWYMTDTPIKTVCTVFSWISHNPNDVGFPFT